MEILIYIYKLYMTIIYTFMYIDANVINIVLIGYKLDEFLYISYPQLNVKMY